MDKIGYSIEEAADACGIGRTVMCALIRDGAIKSVKIGRRRVIPAESVRAYMRGLIAAQHGETGGVA
jgi:excisionase family DNA binding protein